MKRTIFIGAGILTLALIVFLARVSILRAMGAFLVVQDDLKKADVIIVLGGGNDRVREAVRLYKQGVAPYILMTGKMVADGMKRSAVRWGVPAQDILVEPEAASTYQHPIYVKPIIEEKGFQSAIIVSSPYHMRRSAMLFNRAFRKSHISLSYYPAQDSFFMVDGWWKNKSSRITVGQEYMKLLGNMFGTRVSRFMVGLKKMNENEF